MMNAGLTSIVRAFNLLDLTGISVAILPEWGHNWGHFRDFAIDSSLLNK